MKILLDDSRDLHQINVERYGNSTVNIIIRVLIDSKFSKKTYKKALKDLSTKHPYLIGRVAEEPLDEGTSAYYMDCNPEQDISYSIKTTDSGELTQVFNSLSAYRAHKFDHANGELAHLNIWHDDKNTLLEFSFSHLLGEVESGLIMLSDLLNFIDQYNKGTTPTYNICKRYLFDPKRYGWDDASTEANTLALPSDSKASTAPWPFPDFKYGRYSFPMEKFTAIGEWLRGQNIEAKPIDVFYFAAARILNRRFRRDISFWIIFSYRHLLLNPSEHSSVNNEAVFCPADATDTDLNDLSEWIKSFHHKRKEALSKENILGMINFFRGLNKAMQGTPLEKGRMLLNSYIRMPDFAFNNYGILDKYFKDRETFSIKDVDIQDAVPAQEVRMFGLRNEIKFSPAIFSDSGFTPFEFWQEFNLEIDKLMNQ